MEELLSKLFTSREVAHVLHLKSKGEGSYAQHKALNEYYDAIVDIIDDLAETYQGQFGLLDFSKITNIGDVDTENVIKYFEELTSYVEKNRESAIGKAKHLTSQTDEVLTILYKTLYKLKNLK